MLTLQSSGRRKRWHPWFGLSTSAPSFHVTLFIPSSFYIVLTLLQCVICVMAEPSISINNRTILPMSWAHPPVINVSNEIDEPEWDRDDYDQSPIDHITGDVSANQSESRDSHAYQGLIEAAPNFLAPIFVSPPPVFDPLYEEDPYRAKPLLLDLMHLEPVAVAPYAHPLSYRPQPAPYSHRPLFATPPRSQQPPPPLDLDDIPHESTVTDLAKVYEHLQTTHPDIYYELYHKSKKKGGKKDLSEDDDDDNALQSSPPDSKRPVAQSMLFSSKSSSKHYYKPFKVNTINVYGKYLNHGGYGPKHRCSKASRYGGKLTGRDVEAAVRHAASTVEWYENTVTNNAMETKRRTPYIPAGVLDSKMFEYASQYLKNKKCYNKMDVITILPKVDVKGIVGQYEMAACGQSEKIMCDPKAKYRSIDGSCNNLKKKLWGKSFTCHRRLLPPDYADGVAMPRVAHDGSKLPNARELSSLLLPDIEVVDHKLTSMVMSFGQFIIHDITRTLPTSNDIKCCPTKRAKHPECMGIDIKDPDDVLIKYFNQTCMNFVRSIVCNPCSLGPREQQNQATHTFDMSHQYGLRLNDSIALRTLRGGQLRSSWTSTYPKEELPPKMAKEDPGCNVRPVPPRFKCFESADGIRASQHPALQALHTAFHRRHNQHAARLAKINPHWDDEKIYQETRRIMVAEQSAIIYGEYLPSIFGRKLMKHFRLSLTYKGYTKYDPKLNPSTIQEFIVAAGRFGHSQVNDQFSVLFKDKKMSYSYSLRDNFFETTIISLGHSGGVLKGLSVDLTEAVDPYFVDDIKNQLYHLRKEKIGRDLPAFNIQRGRDHGIPGYVYYLDFCFGFKVKHWSDLVTFIPKKQLKKIQLFYKHWKDIDIFIGGISERLISGAAFGPTFACINGIQFYNFKYGDRFYFEHGYEAGSFTPAQLDNIRYVSSLSSLMCKTHKDIEKLPKNPFYKPSAHNPFVSCHKFPELDYSLWVDKKGGKKKRAHYRHHSPPHHHPPYNHPSHPSHPLHPPHPSHRYHHHHHHHYHPSHKHRPPVYRSPLSHPHRAHPPAYSNKYHYQYPPSKLHHDETAPEEEPEQDEEEVEENHAEPSPRRPELYEIENEPDEPSKAAHPQPYPEDTRPKVAHKTLPTPSASLLPSLHRPSN